MRPPSVATTKANTPTLVHAARYPDVKRRRCTTAPRSWSRCRPGVVEQVEEDLEILQNLAAHAGRHWQPAADYDLVGLAAEFTQTLKAELDYLREGRSADRFAADFAGNPDVHIPRVF